MKPIEVAPLPLAQAPVPNAEVLSPVAHAPWPKADPALLVEDEVTLPIQINGKRRGEITVPKDMPKEEVEKRVLADEAVLKALAGAAPKKLIVVPGRIVNVVI